jgi:hypothetical protein
MGKSLVVGALALLLGVFVGGLGPRAELRRARAEVAELKAAAARGGATAALPLALGLGSLVAAQQRARAQAPGPPRFVPADPRGGPSAPDPDPRPAHPERGDAGAGPRFDSKALAAAQAAADVRAAQYRAAFVQEAGLPPAGQAAMDQAIARMNQELGKMADRVAAQLESKSKLTPRDMADLGARVLDIYRKADDDFKAGLDNRAWAALDRTDFDLLTQVDLGAFERLAERVSTMQLPRGPERP